MGSIGEELTEPTEREADGVVVDLFEAPRRLADPAARKRAAVEMIRRHERALRNTARRYSLCADDADDAYQRTLEIVLLKAPTDNQRELIRWTHTVMKHEALAVRRNRERLLGTTAPPSGEDEGMDWVTLIPAPGDGPELQVERREQIARSREALQALKPAELRALTLLGEGYSYAEISELTGFSRTKVNRSLAEGRERFRLVIAHGEDGSRCEEMRPLISAFCDGEAAPRDAAIVREHLRACAPCRAAMRSYRAAPRAAAALLPFLPLGHAFLPRLREVLSHLHSRLTGGGHAVAQLGSGGGTGLAAATKAAAVIVAAGGTAAAGMATGAVPSPFDSPGAVLREPAIERVAPDLKRLQGRDRAAHANRPHRTASKRDPRRDRSKTGPARKDPAATPSVSPPREEATEVAAPVPTEPVEPAVEYSPPAPEPAPVSEPSSPSGDTGAGEFGP